MERTDEMASFRPYLTLVKSGNFIPSVRLMPVSLEGLSEILHVVSDTNAVEESHLETTAGSGMCRFTILTSALRTRSAVPHPYKSALPRNWEPNPSRGTYHYNQAWSSFPMAFRSSISPPRPLRQIGEDCCLPFLPAHIQHCWSDRYWSFPDCVQTLS